MHRSLKQRGLVRLTIDVGTETVKAIDQYCEKKTKESQFKIKYKRTDLLRDLIKPILESLKGNENV